MHGYIAKFGDMREHAYTTKPTNSASIILTSNFIEGAQNPHVKNKLRSCQVKNLKDIFGHAIHEDQKQKIRVLDFGVSSKLKHAKLRLEKSKSLSFKQELHYLGHLLTTNGIKPQSEKIKLYLRCSCLRTRWV